MIIADDSSYIMAEGSFDAIALHRRGLYAGGQDGVLRLIEIKTEDCKVLEKCSIGQPITSLGFSPSYRHLAIGSSQVIVL